MILRFGELEIDVNLFEIRRGGTPIPIQRKVFDALLYLARNRDRVVTKQEILEQVWGGLVVSDDALTQVVRKARHAVGQSIEIRTIRGRGYRLCLAPPACPAADFLRSDGSGRA